MLEGNTVTGEIMQEAAAFEEPLVSLPALLLHACCGPCSASVVEQLAPRFRLTLYFCNSNIYDEAEYKKRLETQRQFVENYNKGLMGAEPISLVCAPYEPEEFLELIKGNETCAEGGKRCRICINDRLERTVTYAAMNRFDYYSTTLSVSKHKDHGMIVQLGKALALRYRLSFIDDDFKKDGGEQRSAELSKDYGLYRQNYCGCSFSKR